MTNGDDVHARLQLEAAQDEALRVIAMNERKNLVALEQRRVSLAIENGKTLDTAEEAGRRE